MYWIYRYTSSWTCPNDHWLTNITYKLNWYLTYPKILMILKPWKDNNSSSHIVFCNGLKFTRHIHTDEIGAYSSCPNKITRNDINITEQWAPKMERYEKMVSKIEWHAVHFSQANYSIKLVKSTARTLCALQNCFQGCNSDKEAIWSKEKERRKW